MKDAVDGLRKWLTNFYKELVKDASSKGDLDYAADYDASHWLKADLKEMCEELHQIIYDYGREELISIVKFFMDISGERFADEVFDMFSCTVEHSH